MTVVTSSCRIPAYTFQAFDNRLLMLPTGIAAAAAAANKHVTPVERKRDEHEDECKKKTSFFTVEPVCSSFIRCSHLIRKINIDNRIFVVSSLLICKCYRMQKQNQERKKYIKQFAKRTYTIAAHRKHRKVNEIHFHAPSFFVCPVIQFAELEAVVSSFALRWNVQKTIANFHNYFLVAILQTIPSPKMS